MPAIEYPISVEKIEFDISKPIIEGLSKDVIGSYVAVRCGKEGKTYLGLFIGEVPLHSSAKWEEETKTLTFWQGVGNPAMFVFELNRVVLGAESFWNRIETEAQLSDITDDDISNVWYVRALEELRRSENGKKEG